MNYYHLREMFFLLKTRIKELKGLEAVNTFPDDGYSSQVHSVRIADKKEQIGDIEEIIKSYLGSK